MEDQETSSVWNQNSNHESSNSAQVHQCCFKLHSFLTYKHYFENNVIQSFCYLTQFEIKSSFYLQVRFESSAMAQILYSGEQSDRGQQQVMYTADGSSYTSVETAEHTLVYIHPADGAQVMHIII